MLGICQDVHFHPVNIISDRNTVGNTTKLKKEYSVINDIHVNCYLYTKRTEKCYIIYCIITINEKKNIYKQDKNDI